MGSLIGIGGLILTLTAVAELARSKSATHFFGLFGLER
jgi:hypothetical protein